MPVRGGRCQLSGDQFHPRGERCQVRRQRCQVSRRVFPPSRRAVQIARQSMPGGRNTMPGGPEHDARHRSGTQGAGPPPARLIRATGLWNGARALRSFCAPPLLAHPRKSRQQKFRFALPHNAPINPPRRLHRRRRDYSTYLICTVSLG
jgi:hypothetical protein